MNLYSYKGAYPYPLPTDISKYDITDFVLAPEKPILLPGQVLEWNNGWIVRKSNESELALQWQAIRNQRNDLLKESDIDVIKLYELNQPVPENLVVYRQALRDITTQENPFYIVWPEKES